MESSVSDKRSSETTAGAVVRSAGDLGVCPACDAPVVSRTVESLGIVNLWQMTEAFADIRQCANGHQWGTDFDRPYTATDDSHKESSP